MEFILPNSTLSVAQFNTYLSNLNSKLPNRNKTKKVFKEMKKINETFYYSQFEFIKIKPEKGSKLDTYKDGSDYFYVIEYEHINGKSEYDTYSVGNIRIVQDNKDSSKKMLEFTPVNRKKEWYIKNGYLSFNNKELDFVDVSQILSNYKNILNFKSQSKDGYYDELITEMKVDRVLTPLFFNINKIPYIKLKTDKKWEYHISNKFTFDGREYFYTKLENMSHKFIIDNYSDYINFREPNDYHSVYSQFIDVLFRNKIISLTEEQSGNGIFEVGYQRAAVINWLGITPTNKNPEKVPELNLPKVNKINLKRGDEVQLKLENIKDIIIKQHKTALEMNAKHLEVNIYNLNKTNLEFKVIDFGEFQSLLESEEFGRLRVNNDYLIVDKNQFIQLSEEDKDKLMKNTFIKDYDKELKKDEEKVIFESLKNYKIVQDDETILNILKNQILLTFENDIKGFGNEKDKYKFDISKLKKKRKEKWLDVFKEYEDILKEMKG